MCRRPCAKNQLEKEFLKILHVGVWAQKICVIVLIYDKREGRHEVSTES